MASREPEPRTFRFGPVEQRGLVGSLRTGQILATAWSCVTALLLFRASPNGPGFAAALALLAAGGASAFVAVRGRTAEQWLPVLGSWALTRARGQHRYRSPLPFAGRSARPGLPSRAATPPLPPALAGCEVLEVALAEDRRLGVIRDRRAGAYTAILVVRIGAFGLLATEEQERRLERWGRVLASLAVDGGAITRLQILERTLPSDGDELDHYLAEAASPDLDAEHPCRRSYEALVDAAAGVTRDHVVFVAVQVDARRAMRRASRDAGLRGVDRDRQACAVLAREIQALAGRFDSAELEVAGLLSPSQCDYAIRHAFDPFASEPSVPTAPVATETTWDRYRCDGAWHRSYWIRDWPRLEVGPGFFGALLLTPDAVRSVSVIFEPVPPRRARTAVEAAITSDEADERLREERGFRTSARRRKQQLATRQREQELAEGHEELRFSGFITVSAASEDDLERACEEVETAARRAYLDFDTLWGEQEAGFVHAALPLARGLAAARPMGLGG